MSLFIITIIEHLKYFGIFFGTFFEGPMVGLLSGFLARLGILSLYLVYFVHVIGDLTSDLLYYFIGYYGKTNFLSKIKISDKSLTKAKNIQTMIHSHPRKVIIFGKLTHLFGLPILLGVGMSHYPWKKFFLYDVIATLLKSFILIGLGYYLAEFWTKANNFITYLGWFGLLFIVIIIIYLISRRIIKSL